MQTLITAGDNGADAYRYPRRDTEERHKTHGKRDPAQDGIKGLEEHAQVDG